MLLIMGLGGQEMLLILLALILPFTLMLLPIMPLWTILKKAGQNPALSLLALFPGIGLVLSCI